MLRTIALCSSLRKAAGLCSRLGDVDGVDLFVLITNDGGRRGPWFFTLQALHFLRVRPREQICLLRRLVSRRLKITRARLHDPKVVTWLRSMSPDVGLHATPVIYRAPVLDSFSLGVLNPHIGMLPRYRGRSVMEWSLLHGDPTGICPFFMDEGIDTGSPIVLRKPISVDAHGDVANAKEYLFSLDADIYAEALETLQRPDFEAIHQNSSDGLRWYVMSNLFTAVVATILTERGEGAGRTVSPAAQAAAMRSSTSPSTSKFA